MGTGGHVPISAELAERLRRFYSPTSAEVAEDDARWRRREMETQEETAHALEMGHADARWLRVLRRWEGKHAVTTASGTTPMEGA